MSNKIAPIDVVDWRTRSLDTKMSVILHKVNEVATEINNLVVDLEKIVKAQMDTIKIAPTVPREEYNTTFPVKDLTDGWNVAVDEQSVTDKVDTDKTVKQTKTKGGKNAKE